MSWPHYTLLVWWAWSFIVHARRAMRSREASHGQVLAAIALLAALFVGQGLLLHAGGFW